MWAKTRDSMFDDIIEFTPFPAIYRIIRGVYCFVNSYVHYDYNVTRSITKERERIHYIFVQKVRRL